MDYLLDTHTLLWSLNSSEKLPEHIKEIINNRRNRIFVSNVSLWEIEIKHHKNPSLMPYTAQKIYNALNRADFIEMDVRDEYIFELANISSQGIHKDPFDHLLLATAKCEEMVLISHDTNTSLYKDVHVLSY